ncbi:response regulator [Bdellovibrio sp. HCB288]|uniref:response regulator n=1 Tax=Bdellovibrio sp. HCB288 TaxID=3394355 RepID=UPI0039B41C51
MRKILAIDDDPMQIESLQDNLKHYDLEVSGVHTAEDALEQLKRLPIEAVVLDFRLGDETDGLSILSKIRKQDKFVPVVLFSGAADSDNNADCIVAGVDFILPKGGRPGSLPTAIKRMLENNDNIIVDLELWSEGNPEANKPMISDSSGKVYSAHEMIAEMKKCSTLGRELLHMYRLGVNQVMVAIKNKK